MLINSTIAWKSSTNVTIVLQKLQFNTFFAVCEKVVKFYFSFLQGNWKLKVQKPVIQGFGNVLTSLPVKYLTKPAFLLFLDSLLVHFSSNRKMEPFFPTLQWLRPKKANIWPWFVFLVKSTNWNLLLTNMKLGKPNDYIMVNHLKCHLQRPTFTLIFHQRHTNILEQSYTFQSFKQNNEAHHNPL